MRLLDLHINHSSGILAADLGQHHVARVQPNECCDPAVVGVEDQAAFPVTGLHSRLYRQYRFHSCLNVVHHWAGEALHSLILTQLADIKGHSISYFILPPGTRSVSDIAYSLPF